jgi:hypothetical protein
MHYMRHRIAIALLILAAAPATAAGNTPLDDRAAARAFADAASRVQPEIASASKQLKALGTPVKCRVRAPRRHRAAVNELRTSLHVAHTIAGFTRTVVPVIERASNELHGIETADPALRGGRTAWRRLRRTYAGFAELPAGNACAQLRRYVRNGYRHTPATRRATRAFDAMMAWDTTDIDRRMKRALERLIELGIPAAEADAFDGELGE